MALRAFLVYALAMLLCTHIIAAPPEQAVVYIKVWAVYPTGEKKELSRGSGFLVTENGVVVTARHVVDIPVPEAAKRYIEGAWGSKDNTPHPLYPCDTAPINVDITTLCYSPALGTALGIRLPFLAVSPSSLEGMNVKAWGFPYDQERLFFPGQISGVMGMTPFLLPMSAAVLPGMSGGPVVDANGVAVGVITGGGQITVNGVKQPVPLNYMTPIRHVIESLRSVGAPVASGEIRPPPPAPYYGDSSSIGTTSAAVSVPVSAEGSVYLYNDCKYAVDFALRYRDKSGNWRTAAWYPATGNGRIQLVNERNEPISSSNGIFYYWAKVKGSDLTWEGSQESGRIYQISGRDYRFRERELTRNDDGNWVFRLQCNNIP